MDDTNTALNSIEQALQKNYDTFCQYAKLHMAKDTDEGNAKAHRNLDFAEEVRHTLKLIPALREQLTPGEDVREALDFFDKLPHRGYDHYHDNDKRANAIETIRKALQKPQAVDDYFAEIVGKARVAAEKAMRKFPQPNYVSLKIAEEAGEVVRGCVHYAEGRMEWEEVEGEIVQLMAMLYRIINEGDQVNGVIPPHLHKRGEE